MGSARTLAWAACVLLAACGGGGDKTTGPEPASPAADGSGAPSIDDAGAGGPAARDASGGTAVSDAASPPAPVDAADHPPPPPGPWSDVEKCDQMCQAYCVR